MADITVTGGAGASNVDLGADQGDNASTQAKALAAMIDSSFSSGIASYYQGGGVNSSNATEQYLVVPSAVAGNGTVQAGIYTAVVVQNTASSATVKGGSIPQVILASTGGLTYSGGTATVDALGGNNNITFTGSGNSVVFAGSGVTDISSSGGEDAVGLGTGAASINVHSGFVYVLGNTSSMSGAAVHEAPGYTGNTQYELFLANGSQASTVTSGTGSYYISGGVGGGLFDGGTSGKNLIYSGTGTATIIGGGDGDFLEGSSTADSIVASSGSELLVASGASDTIDAGSGNDAIVLSGNKDYVQLGTGHASISVTGIKGTESEIVAGSATVPANLGGNTNNTFSLSFYGDQGSAAASTVLAGGAGSYYIAAGAGGGSFAGGTGGKNSIIGDDFYNTGATLTIFGAGAGDYLKAGLASASIIAGVGNETLAAGGLAGQNGTQLGAGATGKVPGTGAGNDTLVGSAQYNDAFVFVDASKGTTITINNYHVGDVLYFANAADAASPQAVTGSGDTFTLSDGTKIILAGYNSTVSGGIGHA